MAGASRSSSSSSSSSQTSSRSSSRSAGSASSSSSSSRRATIGLNVKDQAPVARIPLEVLRDSKLSALSRLAYAALVSFCEPAENECSVSLIEIAERMGITAQNVSRLIGSLEAQGAISVQREGVRGKSNRYTLNRGV